MNKSLFLILLFSCSIFSMEVTPEDTVIETAHLIVRKLKLSDAAAMIPLLQDPQATAGTQQTDITIQGAEGFIQRILKSYEDNGYGRYAFIKKDTGEFVGFGGLNKTKAIDNREMVTVTISLAKAHQKSGYAREVALAGLPKIPEKFPDLEIFAAIDKAHKDSLEIALKNGFKFLRLAHYNRPGQCNSQEINLYKWQPNK